jgi:Icc-related predicted phosphoesterase
MAVRILAVSDLRIQSLDLLEEVIERVKPDLLLYAGDDVERFGPRGESWSPLARRLPHGLAGVIGNDCRPRAKAALRQAGCRDLHEEPIILEGLAIVGLEGGPISRGVGIGPTLYTDSEARKHLERMFRLTGDLPVLLVSHAPPYGVLDFALRFGAQNIGSREVLRALDNPRLGGVICGHVHLQGGRMERRGDCLIVNCASHDDPSAPLRYAVLTWDGTRLSATLDVHDPRGGLAGIYRMNVGHAKLLRANGVKTLRDIQRIGPEGLAAIVGGHYKRYWLGAKALIEGRPILRKLPLPVAPDALFLDVETSLSPSEVWMVAFASAGGRIEQFYELERRDRRRLLQALDARIREQAPSQFVQWSGYDRNALERAYRSIGQKPPRWLDKAMWLDAMWWTHGAFVLPLGSLSIKPVSEYFGYTYVEDQLTGFQVGYWYQNYLSRREPFDVSRVEVYNRDDVEALKHVVKVIQRLAASEATPEVVPEVPCALPRRRKRLRPLSERRAMVGRAVAKCRKAFLARVRAGEMTRPRALAAVAKFADYMRRTHLPKAGRQRIPVARPESTSANRRVTL